MKKGIQDLNLREPDTGGAIYHALVELPQPGEVRGIYSAQNQDRESIPEVHLTLIGMCMYHKPVVVHVIPE